METHKEYLDPFALEETKFVRLVDTIRELLQNDTSPTVQVFDVFLSGNRKDQFNNQNEVLQIENSRRHTIQRLLITSSCQDKTIVVDYGGLRNNPGAKSSKVISVSVKGDNPGWVSSAISAVEERVEISKQRNLPQKLTLAGILMCALFVLLFHYLSWEMPVGSQLWLRNADIDKLGTMVKPDKILTGDQLAEIATWQYRNILETLRPSRAPRILNLKDFVVFALPFLVITGCGIALMNTCYPNGIFLWGDELARSEARNKRKNLLWGILITLMGTSILARFLYSSIEPWIK